MKTFETTHPAEKSLKTQLDNEDMNQLQKTLKSNTSTREIYRTLKEHGVRIDRQNLQNYRNSMTGTKK